MTQSQIPAPSESSILDSATLGSLEAVIAEAQRLIDAYNQQAFPPRSREFFALELNGEAGELANIEKKRWSGREVAHEQFADEAADVLIAVINYANAAGIPLGQAFARKVAEIERRRQALDREATT